MTFASNLRTVHLYALLPKNVAVNPLLVLAVILTVKFALPIEVRVMLVTLTLILCVIGEIGLHGIIWDYSVGLLANLGPFSRWPLAPPR